ncbi:chemotaxis protein CheW [Roseateles koreensis]|uniref:Chemotaxis protein CheW n=1 Tax=Roseateles koreensis TaxID=2987526 RepID=A0ABT5KSQ4_9BURK|nr:chemotaxis protein CheW [Roseateles koreensis]MDC8785966.1 chemotaxis protein CheW [Roseateles koreensis]
MALKGDAHTPESGQARQLLRLACAGEDMVIPVEAVREILEMARLTPIPQSPDFVMGVMNLRGAVVPVIDLSARFDRGRSPIGRRTAIVIVEIIAMDGSKARFTAGLLVDAVYEVLEVPAQSIEVVPSMGVSVAREFVQGMLNVNGTHALLLNLQQILATDKLTDMIRVHHQVEEPNVA